MLLGKDILGDLIDRGNQHTGEFSPNEEYIRITTIKGAKKFDKDTQLGNDSIDIRLGNSGYRMRRDYDFISTLDEKITNCFDEIEFTIEEGLLIAPGETVFIGSAERIELSGPFFGEVMCRSKFARMGISVNCSCPKFQGYSDAIIAFQITNNNLVPIKVFPYQAIAQLVINKVDGYPIENTGLYFDEETLKLPLLGDELTDYYNDLDIERIEKNKSRISKYKDKNGKIDRLYLLRRNLIIFVISLDIIIFSLAILVCFVQERNVILFGILSAILTAISGIITFINKGEKDA